MLFNVFRRQWRGRKSGVDIHLLIFVYLSFIVCIVSGRVVSDETVLGFYRSAASNSRNMYHELPLSTRIEALNAE